jgi:Fe2+ transport system protein B
MFSVKEYIKKLNQDTYLSHKYIGTVMILVVIPVIFLSAVFFINIQSIIEKEIGHSYERVLNQYIESINNKLSIYENLQDTLSTNGIVLDIFSRQDQYKREDTFDLSIKFSREIDSLI